MWLVKTAASVKAKLRADLSYVCKTDEKCGWNTSYVDSWSNMFLHMLFLVNIKSASFHI